MKKVRILPIVLLSFFYSSIFDTAWATLNDLAIYRPKKEWWMTKKQQETCANYIKKHVVAKSEVIFSGYDQSEQDSLSNWVATHMNDGESDVLIILDICPAVLYHGELDGSLAEAWMENGNMLIWTGSEPFFKYVDTDGSKSESGAGTEGASDVLDVSSPELCRGVGTQKATSAVSDYNICSFSEYDAERAFRYDQLLIDSLTSDWHHMSYWNVDEVFAEDSEFYRSDNIVLVNDDGGQFAQFYCRKGEVAGPDGTKNINHYRKKVIAQFLNNWVSLPCFTLVVPDHYPTIQAAIDAARPRDTVLVRAGTYDEQLDMKKGVKLVSDSSDGGNDLVPGPGYAETEYGVESKKVLCRALRTIIDGTGFPGGTEAHPMVDFPRGATVATLIDGFTVQHMPTVDHTIPGHAHVVQCRGASGTMINNIVHDNGSSGLGSHAWFYDQQAPMEERDFRYTNIQYDSHPIIINNVVYRNEGNNMGNNHYAYAIFYNNECFESISVDGHDSPGIGNQHGAHALIVSNLVYKSDWVGIGARKGEEQGAYPINRPTHPVVRNNRVYDSGEKDIVGNQGAGIGGEDTGGYDPKRGEMVYHVIEGNYVNGAQNAAIGCRSFDPNLGYVKIINNEVLNGGEGDLGGGIGLNGAVALEIKGNTSHDNNDVGIGIRNGGHVDLIEGNEVFGNGTAGIGNDGGTALVIRGNISHDNTLGGIGVKNGGHADLIERNEVFNNGAAGINHDGGTASETKYNISYGNALAGIGIKNSGHVDLIEGNEVFGNGTAGIGIQDDVSSVGEIRKNVVRDNAFGGIGCSGAISGIYNNIIARNGEAGIVCFVAPVEVINNVVAHSGTAGIVNNSGVKIIIKNNISYYNTSAGLKSDPGGYSYNCLFANNVPRPCTDWMPWCWRPQYGGAYFPGAGDLLLHGDRFHPVDPLLVDPANYDFHLQATSPAIDTGDPTILDADGTRSDMGAYGGPDPIHDSDQLLRHKGDWFALWREGGEEND